MGTSKSTTSERQLFIYQQLAAGRHFKKSQLAEQFGVDARTIQRDFASLRAFIDEYLPDYTLNFDYKNGYYWLSSSGIGFSKAQCLCIIKILTASRALPKKQLIDLTDRLLNTLDEQDAKTIKQLIRNEQNEYTELQNMEPKRDKDGQITKETDLIKLIWDFSEYTFNRKTVRIKYRNQAGKEKEHLIVPLAITFSEYYFYLINYSSTYKKKLIYRLDRIVEYHKAEKSIPQSEWRSQQGDEANEKKKLQLMYPGKLSTIRFEYRGVVEAALDRFPLSHLVRDKNGQQPAIIEIDAYDTGAMMWLLSQKDMVTVLSPPSFKKQMVETLHKMLSNYE